MLAALGGVIYIYMQFSSSSKGESSDPWSCVPIGSNLVLEIADFKSMPEYMRQLHDLSDAHQMKSSASSNPLDAWSYLVDELDSLRLNQPDWGMALQSHEVVFSSADAGRGENWVLTLAKASKSSAEDQMGSWFKDVSKRDFRSSVIHMGARLNWAVIGECIAVTKSVAAMENVIIEFEKGQSIKQNDAFQKIRATKAEGIPYHIYLAAEKGGWLSLDPAMNSDQCSLSGIVQIPSDAHHSLEVTGKGGPIQVQKILPAQTEILEVMSFASFDESWRKNEEHYASNNASEFWGQAWKNFGDTCQCDMNSMLLSWRTGESGYAVVPMKDSTTAEVAFIGIKEGVHVMDSILPFLKEKLTSPHGIYSTRFPLIFERNMQHTVLIEANYVRQVGSYLVLASSPTDLIAINDSTGTLADQPDFTKAFQCVGENTSRFIYQNQYFTSTLPGSLLALLSQHAYFGISFETGGEHQWISRVALPITNRSNPSETSDSSEEDDHHHRHHHSNTPREWPVKNHRTGELETLIQDPENTVILRDAQGNELWRKPIGASIIGEITQVDALKNGKLQMAFATENGVHILDRNGNELPGFPITPRAEVTGGLHVADYDQSKKYRLLIPLSDGIILNYDINAQPVEGWKHQSLGEDISFIQAAKINGEDVLIAIDRGGQIQLMKRTGEARPEQGNDLSGYATGQKLEIIAGPTLRESKIREANSTEEGTPLVKE
ncbi:MAG: hypothetical protein ACKOZY_02690 [Flavobacteriales bacterium]